MGMSGDFEVAIEEGATMVRVGTAIFGPARPARAMTIKGQRVGFVGAGNMGEALIKGLLGASLVPAEAIHATDVRAERLEELERQYGIQRRADNAAAGPPAPTSSILAVKPQIMDAVLHEIAPAVDPRKLLISIAAGVSDRDGSGPGSRKDARLIRVMPNTPALVLRGRDRHRRRPRGSSPTTSTPPGRSSAPSGAWSCSTRS